MVMMKVMKVMMVMMVMMMMMMMVMMTAILQLFDHRCNDGSTMEGGNTVICDGHHWNSSAPICLSKFYYNESLL